jgi:hypothetical protein
MAMKEVVEQKQNISAAPELTGVLGFVHRPEL